MFSHICCFFCYHQRGFQRSLFVYLNDQNKRSVYHQTYEISLYAGTFRQLWTYMKDCKTGATYAHKCSFWLFCLSVLTSLCIPIINCPAFSPQTPSILLKTGLENPWLLQPVLISIVLPRKATALKLFASTAKCRSSMLESSIRSLAGFDPVPPLITVHVLILPRVPS